MLIACPQITTAGQQAYLGTYINKIVKFYVRNKYTDNKDDDDFEFLSHFTRDAMFTFSSLRIIVGQ